MISHMPRDARASDSWLLLLALLVGCALALAGCGGPATVARKTTMGMYTAIGVCGAIQRACDAAAVDQARKGDDNAAAATFNVCREINVSIHTAEHATDGSVKAIDALAKLGAKDYSAALAPALASGCDLNKAVSTIAKKVPVVIPCGGK